MGGSQEQAPPTSQVDTGDRLIETVQVPIGTFVMVWDHSYESFLQDLKMLLEAVELSGFDMEQTAVIAAECA